MYNHFGYSKGKEDPIKIYYKLIQQNRKKYLETIATPNAEKVDNYLFISTMTDIYNVNKEIFRLQNEELADAFEELFEANLNPDVDKCWSTVQNLKFVTSIFGNKQNIKIK